MKFMKNDKNITKWLNKLSLRSIQKIKVILEITISELEIITIDKSKKEYYIVNRPYNQENISLIEVQNVIKHLNKELLMKINVNKNLGLPEIRLIIEDENIINNLKTIINEINKIISKQNSSSEEIKFSEDDGILILQGKEIDFSKKYNQKGLLTSLFKDKKKNWYYDEIIEDWGEEYEKGDWRKCYTAGDEINKEILIKTGISNFIVKNTKQIKISSRYI